MKVILQIGSDSQQQEQTTAEPEPTAKNQSSQDEESADCTQIFGTTNRCISNEHDDECHATHIEEYSWLFDETNEVNPTMDFIQVLLKRTDTFKIGNPCLSALLKILKRHDKVNLNELPKDARSFKKNS